MSACNAGELGSIPRSGRSFGEGNGNPLQYSYLENSMDGGAWWATVHGIAKSLTRLSNFTDILWKCWSLTFLSDSLQPHDCNPPGSSVHGILQARILQWVAISFSRGSSTPGTEPGSPAFQADSLLSEPSGKPHYILYILLYYTVYVDTTFYVCVCVCIYIYTHIYIWQNSTYTKEYIAKC